MGKDVLNIGTKFRPFVQKKDIAEIYFIMERSDLYLFLFFCSISEDA